MTFSCVWLREPGYPAGDQFYVFRGDCNEIWTLVVDQLAFVPRTKGRLFDPHGGWYRVRAVLEHAGFRQHSGEDVDVVGAERLYIIQADGRISEFKK